MSSCCTDVELSSHFARFLPACLANITPVSPRPDSPTPVSVEIKPALVFISNTFALLIKCRGLRLNWERFSLIPKNSFSCREAFLPGQQRSEVFCWPPPGFKWPLMALDGCSGSGSLKLGEALYESLLHLSPLLLPVTPHTYGSHDSTHFVANFLDHNRNVTENQTPVFQSIWKRQILSAHFASHLVRGLEFQSANTNIYFSSLCGTL